MLSCRCFGCINEKNYEKKKKSEGEIFWPTVIDKETCKEALVSSVNTFPTTTQKPGTRNLTQKDAQTTQTSTDAHTHIQTHTLSYIHTHKHIHTITPTHSHTQIPHMINMVSVLTSPFWPSVLTKPVDRHYSPLKSCMIKTFKRAAVMYVHNDQEYACETVDMKASGYVYCT